MKSSPILGHLSNSFLTRGRRFQSSPVGRVNCGVGNTACKMPSACIIGLNIEHGKEHVCVRFHEKFLLKSRVVKIFGLSQYLAIPSESYTSSVKELDFKISAIFG